MIESNGSPVKDVQARRRRRKSAGWKSGLMLTGLGAVVLGAGYLAGVNAPAVAQTSTPQAVAQTGSEILNRDNNAQGQNSFFQAPNNGDGSGLGQGDSGLGQGFQFNDDDNEGFFGNGGTSQFQGGGGSGSTNQFNQQFGGRNRQFRGFSQQQPNFGGPVTRSRGS